MELRTAAPGLGAEEIRRRDEMKLIMGTPLVVSSSLPQTCPWWYGKGMERQAIGAGSVELVCGDITLQRVDVVVTAANSGIRGGGGVDGAVHGAAGPQLLEACRELGGCPTGSAVMTEAFGLGRRGIKNVIHAVGPIYSQDLDASALLRGAYVRSLELVKGVGARSVALPSIGTGIYGYPLDEAAPIAVRAASGFLAKTGSSMRVIFVLFDDTTYDYFARALKEL